MTTAQAVRDAFPEGVFGSPASEADIAKAERVLGHALPSELRSLYVEFDGFLGPTNAPFLFPVLARPNSGRESLASYTQFFRAEEGMPEWVQRAVVLGDNGTGTGWFLLLDEGNRLVRWDAEWEEYEVVDGGLLDEWRREKEFYESLGRDA
jgi:hypothetical protein